MKIFIDYHHSGAARGQVLLLQERLKHDVYFPNAMFVDGVVRKGLCDNTQLLSVDKNWLKELGEDIPFNNDISLDEFMSTEWDVVMCTRIETQNMFRWLVENHPRGKNIKIIGMTGNDAVEFDWGLVRNLMATDYPTYENAPRDVNKIYYSQEISSNFGRKYVPITDHIGTVVNCYINCWNNFDGPWVWDAGYARHGHCPHCGMRTDNTRLGASNPVSPFGIWAEVRRRLSGDVAMRSYGIACDDGFIPEPQLPVYYENSVATIHMKTYDGYGFSVLQSIASGRIAIVPKQFFRYRTAGKYLIPGVTCIEVDWSVDSLEEAVRYITGDIHRADVLNHACYDAARGLFNWDCEAFRVDEFLSKLK